MVLVWMLLFVVLVLFELHHLAFYALFVAVGAFAAGVVALIAPDNIGLQTIVAIAVSIGGVILVRPYVSNVFHRHRGGHVARGVHGGLVGQEAVTLDEVGDLHQIGHVRLAGERWLAITGGPKIEAGRSVFVTAVRGT
ncbi:MAG: NfeD-like C-terminal, partner-binding, partial [Acidimicrobiaceae bacterium]